MRSITPIRVPDDELDRRRERYARLAPPGVAVHLDNLTITDEPGAGGPGVPSSLDTDDDVARSNDLVLAMALATDPADFDLVLPDCVLDPGVGRVDVEPVPIVGILQLAATHLALLGRRFAAVTRNRAIADELAGRVRSYGLGEALVGVDVLDLDFAAIRDERRWQEALAPSRLSAGERGAGAVVNGCSAVEVDDDAHGVPVVDPTALALRLLGVSTRLFASPGAGSRTGGGRA